MSHTAKTHAPRRRDGRRLGCWAVASAILIALTITALCLPLAAYGDNVRFTSWKNTTGLIQGTGDHGRGIQAANYHATTDGRIAYCYAQGAANPDSDIPYRHIGTASMRASVIIKNGWPSTNTINGVKLSDDEARQATQTALWMLGDYGFTVPYNSISGTYNDDAVQIGARAAAAAKYLYTWSEGKTTTARYDIYEDSVSSEVYQVMVVAEENAGYLEIKKSSTAGEITSDNPNYALSGASFGVYSNQACTSLVTTLTTNAAGYAKSGEIKAGTYYVKEITAPKGYALDGSVRKVGVSGGSTTTLSVSDEPLAAQPEFVVRKTDAENADAQGSASLANAEFTVRYYTGLFDSSSEAEASGSPTRTWVVRTDADGKAALNSTSLLSGDTLYKDDSGNAVIPIGTLLIQETKAPSGYLLNDETMLVRVSEDQLRANPATAYQAPTVSNEIVRGGVSIQKSLVCGDTSRLEGVQFELISKNDQPVIVEGRSFKLGEVVSTLIIDAEGKASTGNDALPCGKYDVVEVSESVPESVIPYEDAQGEGSPVVATITIGEEASDHRTIYPISLSNYAKPSFTLIKMDGDSLTEGSSKEDALRVQGSEWLLEYQADEWEEVERGATDENGILSFSENALSKWGAYRLTETKAAGVDDPQGYLSREDSRMPASVTFTIDETTWEKIEQGCYEGIIGDSWAFEMIDGTPTLTREEHNWLKREIEAVKLDEDTDAPVSETGFALYRWTGSEDLSLEELEARAESHNAFADDPRESVNPSFAQDPANWELVERGFTDKHGSVLFDGLAFGLYMLAEETPNAEYAEWWESDLSTWGAYWFTCDGESGKSQTQVFENDRIELETTIDKSTIEMTSAAFESLPDQAVSFANVNIEEYRYDVAFSNGSSNVRADQYTVIDNCEFTNLGVRMQRLWTPVVKGDKNGAYNLWYRTNLTEDSTIYSSASATSDNPENQMADGTNRISTQGWKLWAQDLSSSERTLLEVGDLQLAEGEYVSSLMLEFGAVMPGFSSDEPLTYLVTCTEALIPLDSLSPLIPNSASSHITRNWSGGSEGTGLFDDARDDVFTKVLGSFSFPTENKSHALSATGDEGAPLWLLTLCGAAGFAAASIKLARCGAKLRQ